MSETPAPFRLARGAMPPIVLPAGARPFVARAAEDAAGDIAQIFGERHRLVSQPRKGVATGRGAIVLSIRGGGRENYSVESRPGNVLEIAGSDDRGVMFGVYRFAADCLGVDPFRFWSGREPAKTRERAWPGGIRIRQGDPSFRFRGWFINDEDFLNGFRPEENGRREIDYPRYHACFGPALMDAICESAVRAGFNMIVCASYVDILNPDERRLLDVASARGLYLTTHHQEPLGAGARQLDLHFPEIRGTTYATRPDLWRAAWRRYAAEWAKYPDVVSPWEEDADRLCDVVGDLFRQTKRDLLPELADTARAGIRARAQSAAFGRCMEQAARASAGLGRDARRQLFERFGYPAAFMRLSSELYAELAAAVEAKDLGDGAAARRHAGRAITLGRRRDALDARYNAGRWRRWYDRDLVYPCRAVMEALEKRLPELFPTTKQKKGR